MVGKDRNIPRFPPPVVVQQLIHYLMFVRPQVSFFIKHFDLPGKNDIDEFLFVDHKVGRWTEESMYRRFNEVTNGLGIGMITASIYRQAAQLIMDKLVKFKWELPDEDNVLDESFGHSGAQAIASYAVEIQGGDLVRKDDKAHFKAGAHKWHKIVIPNPTRRGPLPKRGRDDEHDRGNYVEEQPSTSRPRISQAAFSNILPPITRDISETIARHYLPTLRPTVNPDVDIQPETLLALRRHFDNPSARFKSQYQAKAVQLVFNCKSDLFVILPTGGGKSLTFELLPILEPDGCSVLILPFVALMTEMRQRLKRGMPNAKASQWRFGQSQEDGLPHILLVSIEEAVTPQFQSFIQEMNVRQKLRRWMIDEFHVLVTQSDFRPVFSRLVTTIRLINVPLICLSATIPESYIDRIRLTLASADTAVVRSTTDRPNLRYRVCHLVRDNEEELDKQLCKEIKEQWDQCEDKDGTRFIVFTHTAKAANAFGELLKKKKDEVGISGVVYHSKMLTDDKEKAYIKWKRGECKVLIGTGAIGAGMDYGYVRCVWHRGFGTSVINMIQEKGRAGRDGKAADCRLIYCYEIEKDCKGFIDEESWREQKKYVEEKGCLRAYLTGFVDGVRVDCLSLGEDGLECGHCEDKMRGASLCGGNGRGLRNGLGYNGELNQLRYSDMMTERSELLKDVCMIMEELKRTCGVCWFILKLGLCVREGGVNHLGQECPYIKDKVCLECYGVKHDRGEVCKRTCRGLDFKRGQCCWFCGFPQFLFSEKVHGDNILGRCEYESLSRKLELVGWNCWREKRWKGRVMEKWSELVGGEDFVFVKWLGMTGEHGLSNLMWLVIYFYRGAKVDLDEVEGLHLEVRDRFNING
jgi:superfamily II DNA helicase RecQ